MSLELPVTYLQTVPLPQLPLSTAGLPSQTTGVSQVPLTVMAVAHVFLIYETDKGASHNRNSSNPNASTTADADPPARRKRICLVVDPIASYTKDLDTAVSRCVAASAVTALRFQNEQALWGLRTSLHPLDIVASHSSPADCIRVIPSVIPWFKASTNVVTAQDNAQGWKAVLTKTGSPPLPATFKLQHELTGDNTWFCNPMFSFDSPTDPEIAAQTWLGVAGAATPTRQRHAGDSTVMMGGTVGALDLSALRGGGGSTAGGGRPPLGPGGGGDLNSSGVTNSVLSPVPTFASPSSPSRGGGPDDIAWMLPHAKRDGGASERAAAAVLTHERQKNEVAATQLEAVRTSLEAEKAASKSQQLATVSETAALKKRITELDSELRTLRIERVATADSVQALQAALNSDAAAAIKERKGEETPTDVLTPEPLMVSRPETIGPIPTSLQNAGPSDAEVLAALMLSHNLKNPNSGDVMSSSNSKAAAVGGFSEPSMSPIPRNIPTPAEASRMAGVGRRGPSPSRRTTTTTTHSGGNSARKQQHSSSPHVNFDDSDVSSSAGDNIRPSSKRHHHQNKPPPSPLVVDADIPEPVEKPPWKNILGTPSEDSIDPSLGPSSKEDKERDAENTALVRALLVKNSLQSPMQKMAGSQPSSRSSTPDRRGGSGYDAPTHSSASRGGARLPPHSNKKPWQENMAARGASADRGASAGRRAASPMASTTITATTASLNKLSDHLKAGRKLIEDLKM